MEAVIFDLDGTLADSLSSIAHCANAALALNGLPAVETELFKVFVGDGAAELIHRLLRHIGGESEDMFGKVFADYIDIFTEGCTYNLSLYGGIADAVARLRALPVRLAVLTNKPQAMAERVVDFLFPRGTFDMVVGQRESLAIKPSPDGALMIASQLGIPANKFLYVGDTRTDMLTGKAAGMFTAGVLWGFRSRSELEESGAQAIIETPAEIPELAAGIFQYAQ